MDIFNPAPHESYFDHIKDLKYQLERLQKDNDELYLESHQLQKRLDQVTEWWNESEQELKELRSDYINLLEKVKIHEE